MKTTGIRPPRWADRFLEWYCRPELLEEIQGDIHEVFDVRSQMLGISAARRRFIWDVLRSFRWSTIKRTHLNFSTAMFKNHFKVTFRHLLRQKFYTTIKVTGFALGLACCLLILIFIRHELSFDQQYPKADRIYRVLVDYHIGDQEGRHAITTTPLAKTLEGEFPEVEKAVRIAPDFYEAGSNLVRKEGEAQNVHEEGFIYADPPFLDMFDFPMISGTTTAALTQPFSIVLTASMAAKYFPGENPVGQLLILNNNTNQPFKVTGVMEDLPDNTHFHFNFILSFEGLKESKIYNWGHSNYITYVLLNPQASQTALEAKLPEIVTKYLDPDGSKFTNENYFRFVLQSLTDIHLYSANVQGGDYANQGDIQYIWLFGAVAIFVLLIASINFINLSTARSANRAKEVGIRKVLGSFRKQLVAQFLTESVMLSVLAVVCSLLLAWLALPYFNNLANQHLSLPLNEWWFIPALILAALLIGLLSGAYPSIFLSSFMPAQVLKGKLNQGSKSGKLRSVLVIVQFTTSIVLIVATLIVQQQMNYIQHKKLGFEKDQVLIIEDTYAIGDQIQPFKNALKNLPEVQEVSISSFVPVEGYDRNGASAWPEGNKAEEATVGLAKWYVDQDYVGTLGMKIIQGRDFSVEYPSDSQAMILNKKAVELLGFTDPIGERVSSYSYLDEKTGQLVYDTYTVIGVVEDFHFESMKNDIRGLSLVIGRSTGSTMIKANATDVKQLIGKVNQVWESFAPTEPFRYNFLNERFANMYAFEQRVGKIFAVFAGLAIFVACLGLFALAAFMAEQRTKEIGIRKVLGASISSIFMLLTKNFVVMILISLILATPLAWYFMQSWLKDFVYRTTISWGVFAVAGGITLLIALLTVSYQAVKAAVLNPANTLRTE